MQGPRIVINNEYEKKIGKMGAKQRATYLIIVSSLIKLFPLKYKLKYAVRLHKVKQKMEAVIVDYAFRNVDSEKKREVNSKA